MLLTLHKDDARACLYAVRMEQEEPLESPGEPKAVGRNLAVLMKWKGWNQSETSRRSGVSQRHISDVLSGQTDLTTEKVEQLAASFSLQGWQLLMPDITEELLTTTDLQIIVDTYISKPAGRKLIDGAAEMVRKNG